MSSVAVSDQGKSINKAVKAALSYKCPQFHGTEMCICTYIHAHVCT